MTESGSELSRMSKNPVSYRKKYPELYVLPSEKETISENTVYLTFDDGPSPVTGQVLDVLKRYQVKGTFFVVGQNLKTAAGQEMIRRMLREGHSLGMHSDTHRYRKIYASVEAWLDDFAAVHQRISDITGQQTAIFRFPGGSINIYNASLYQELIAEMTRRGYVYFDWNVSVGDISLSPQRAEALFANVVTRSSGDSRVVILMHDSATKAETVKALPKIIEHYRSKGYSFWQFAKQYLSNHFRLPELNMNTQNTGQKIECPNRMGRIHQQFQPERQKKYLRQAGRKWNGGLFRTETTVRNTDEKPAFNFREYNEPEIVPPLPGLLPPPNNSHWRAGRHNRQLQNRG